jgi:hypothetical protein
VRKPATPITQHPPTFSLHPMPFTPHPAPHNPTPRTLRPSPCILHPAPCAPHHASYTLRRELTPRKCHWAPLIRVERGRKVAVTGGTQGVTLCYVHTDSTQQRRRRRMRGGYTQGRCTTRPRSGGGGGGCRPYRGKENRVVAVIDPGAL